MYVRELMTTAPVAITPDSTLGDAARKMAEGDFGVLPVVENGELRGMLTDRDVCMAATLDGHGAQAQVRAFAHRPVFQCSENDDVHDALAVMRDHRVRRLAVVDGAGKLQGILSMNDIVLASRAHTEIDGAPSFEEVVQSLRGICEHSAATALAH